MNRLGALALLLTIVLLLTACAPAEKAEATQEGQAAGQTLEPTPKPTPEPTPEPVITKECHPDTIGFWSGSNRIGFVSEYAQGNIYAGDVKLEAQATYADNHITFTGIQDFPTNEIFDFTIELLDESGEIRETQTLSNVCISYEADLGSIANLDKAEHLYIMGFDVVMDTDDPLVLDSNTLSGLTNLRYLSLGSCYNTSFDIGALADSTSLSYLRLSCRNITGDIGVLLGMSGLEYLTISGPLMGYVDLEGDIEALSGMTKMKDVFIQSCYNLEGDIRAFSAMTALEVLFLNHCPNLTGDVSALSGLAMLKELNLGADYLGSKLTGDINSFSDMTALESLSLYNLELSGDIDTLSALTDLYELDVCGCDDLNGNISSLASLAKLVTLRIIECKNISGDISALSALPELKNVDFSDSPKLEGTVTLSDGQTYSLD